MSNSTLSFDHCIDELTCDASGVHGFFVNASIAQSVNGMLSAEAVQMHLGRALSGVRDVVSSLADHVANVAICTTRYTLSAANHSVTAVSTQSIAAISRASNGLFSSAVSVLTPSFRQVFSAVAAISLASVVYHATKPITQRFDLNHVDSDDRSCDASDLSSDTSSVFSSTATHSLPARVDSSDDDVDGLACNDIDISSDTSSVSSSCVTHFTQSGIDFSDHRSSALTSDDTDMSFDTSDTSSVSSFYETHATRSRIDFHDANYAAGVHDDSEVSLDMGIIDSSSPSHSIESGGDLNDTRYDASSEKTDTCSESSAPITHPVRLSSGTSDDSCANQQDAACDHLPYADSVCSSAMTEHPDQINTQLLGSACPCADLISGFEEQTAERDCLNLENVTAPVIDHVAYSVSSGVTFTLYDYLVLQLSGLRTALFGSLLYLAKAFDHVVTAISHWFISSVNHEIASVNGDFRFSDRPSRHGHDARSSSNHPAETTIFDGSCFTRSLSV